MARDLTDRDRVAGVLQRSVARLGRTTVARMDTDLPWFGRLSAQDRSWVGLIVDSGVRGFVDWYRQGGTSVSDVAVAAEVFGAAPQALTGVISLQQTVDLVRLAIDVVEENVDDVVAPEDAPDVHASVIRYAREVAFATAEVYARAAEQRGAWDARLEALLVDSVVRSEGEAVLSRASALGWTGRDGVTVVVGPVPTDRADVSTLDELRRTARVGGLDALCAVQGDRLVAVLGGLADAPAAATTVVDHFGAGPVVVGSLVPDLSMAHESAEEAMAGFRAAPGWPHAPRPVPASDLLAERVLLGDERARRRLLRDVYEPLASGRSVLADTLTAWFDRGSSVEGTARALYIHPNTVRYRLRQVAEATHLAPGDPRDAWMLQMALVLGRQARADQDL